MTRVNLRAASRQLSSLVPPVITIWYTYTHIQLSIDALGNPQAALRRSDAYTFPEPKISAVVFGSRRRMITAEKRCDRPLKPSSHH